MAQLADLSALTVITPVDYSGATVLNITESWTNADGTMGTAFVANNVEAYAPGSPIFAWSGDDYLTGSSGHDQFVVGTPIGQDKIFSFDASMDQIDLIGYAGFKSYSDVTANTADDGNGNAVINLGNGQLITLEGVNKASLSASNFQFDQTPVMNNTGNMVISDGAMLPLSGIINNTGIIMLSSTGSETDLLLTGNGITLQGGGQVILSDNSMNVITGTSPMATLTNADNTISGAGQIGAGQMTLDNAGTIVATGSNALVIDTGSNTVTNSGTLAATGSGGLVVLSAVDNSGTLLADGGSLTFAATVTGSGNAQIHGTATLEFGAASAENTTFAADAAGTLKLGDVLGFSGMIAGFDGNDQLDLVNMQFSGDLSLSYAADASGTDGTLTISDGTHTAVILLMGQYDANGFHATSDNGNGTFVTYIG
jgi:hypothetical protein